AGDATGNVIARSTYCASTQDGQRIASPCIRFQPRGSRVPVSFFGCVLQRVQAIILSPRGALSLVVTHAVLGGPPTAPILGVARLGATACRRPKSAGLLCVFIPHATNLRFPADLPDLIVL